MESIMGAEGRGCIEKDTSYQNESSGAGSNQNYRNKGKKYC